MCQTKVLHLHGEKYLFLLVRVTISGCTLVLFLIVLKLSSAEVALVIAPFSFNKGPASLEIAKIVVFGTLLISRADGTIVTFSIL